MRFKPCKTEWLYKQYFLLFIDNLNDNGSKDSVNRRSQKSEKYILKKTFLSQKYPPTMYICVILFWAYCLMISVISRCVFVSMFSNSTEWSRKKRLPLTQSWKPNKTQTSLAFNYNLINSTPNKIDYLEIITNIMFLTFSMFFSMKFMYGMSVTNSTTLHCPTLMSNLIDSQWTICVNTEGDWSINIIITDL